MKRTQDMIDQARSDNYTSEHYRHASAGGFYTDIIGRTIEAVTATIRQFDDREVIYFDHSLKGRISRAKAEKILAGQDWREVVYS